MQEHNKKRSHLNQEERVEIYSLRKQGISLREIGRIIKRPHSTISKELERNSDYLGSGKYRLRWFIPKGGRIQGYSEEYIAEKLNRKPRKKLGYQRAKELFASQVKMKKSIRQRKNRDTI